MTDKSKALQLYYIVYLLELLRGCGYLSSVILNQINICCTMALWSQFMGSSQSLKIAHFKNLFSSNSSLKCSQCSICSLCWAARKKNMSHSCQKYRREGEWTARKKKDQVLKSCAVWNAAEWECAMKDHIQIWLKTYILAIFWPMVQGQIVFWSITWPIITIYTKWKKNIKEIKVAEMHTAHTFFI